MPTQQDKPLGRIPDEISPSPVTDGGEGEPWPCFILSDLLSNHKLVSVENDVSERKV